MIDPKLQREKFEAAYTLLTEGTTTFQKFEKIRTLIKGYNPKIDKTLSAISVEINKLKQLQKGEVIELTVAALPEHTEEQKKRKRILLLFLTHWKQLRSEVRRVTEILEAQRSDGKVIQPNK